MFDLGRVDRADVPNGVIDLLFRPQSVVVKPVLEREIDEAYGFKTFSKRWKRMRKQGSKKGLPALIWRSTKRTASRPSPSAGSACASKARRKASPRSSGDRRSVRLQDLLQALEAHAQARLEERPPRALL